MAMRAGIASILILSVVVLSVRPAAAADPVIHSGHAIAMYGEPKYPAGFEHFDYVNPSAPVGGLMRMGAAGTFDSFNPYVIKGNPASRSPSTA